MASITFLGTGGGKIVILNQRRYSGGLWPRELEETVAIDLGLELLSVLCSSRKTRRNLMDAFITT